MYILQAYHFISVGVEVFVATLYCDIVSGASGDMILSSLLDAGADIEILRQSLSKMEIPGLRIESEKVSRNGMMCTHMILSWDTPGTYRHLPQILEIIQRGHFSQAVQSRCESILQRLAEAEARVHGIPVDKVHFHEVGAVDTIIDVVGIALCLEQLCVDRICFSDITVGHGTVNAAHGVMPVPVPAVSVMLEGFRTRPGAVAAELVTPTGCAVLTALGTQVESLPAGTVTACGYGCGDNVFENLPNILRCIVVEESSIKDCTDDSVWVIQSDMDHVSAEVMAHAGEECLRQGALDISWSPVFMKKGRPGYRLTVLAAPADRELLADTIIRETRTLGVRYYAASRQIAERESGTVTFCDEAVDEKTCTYKGMTFRKLEYESLARIARRTGRPLPDIIDEYVRSR